MSIVDSFDAQSSAVFSPCDVYKPLEGAPEIALIAFNRHMAWTSLPASRARGR